MTCLELTVTPPDDSPSRTILADRFPFSLGRNLHNDLPLPYPSVSGRHAVIKSADDATVVIADLESTNGTRIGDRRIPSGQSLCADLPVELQIGELRIALCAIGPDADTGFTMARSSTQLRQMVDDAVRQSEDEQTRPFFEILSGPGTGRRFHVEPGRQDCTIGTDTDCDVPLPLSEVPAELAAVYWRDSACWIVPKAAGIEFERRPIEERRRLRSGDRFVIDSIELLYFDPLESTLELIEGTPPATDSPSNNDTASEGRDEGDADASDGPSTPVSDDLKSDSPDHSERHDQTNQKPVPADNNVGTDTGLGAIEIGLLIISATAVVATVALLVTLFWN